MQRSSFSGEMEGGSKEDGVSLLQARSNLSRWLEGENGWKRERCGHGEKSATHLATFKDSRSSCGLQGGHSASLPMSKEPSCHVSQCTLVVISSQ